jgi:hypothetical protein
MRERASRRWGAPLAAAALIAAISPAAPAQPEPVRPEERAAETRSEVNGTIRHLTTRRARGRTEVRVAGNGLRRYRLSELLRVHGRWRLNFDVYDAALALSVARRPLATGAVSRVKAEDLSNGVRVVIESANLGDYGFQVSGDTLVVWLAEVRGGRAEGAAVAAAPASWGERIRAILARSD